MPSIDHLLADPVNLALIMAALSLVVSLTTGLYIAMVVRASGTPARDGNRRKIRPPSPHFEHGFSVEAGGRAAGVAVGEDSAVLETRLHLSCSGNVGDDDKGQRFV